MTRKWKLQSAKMEADKQTPTLYTNFNLLNYYYSLQCYCFAYSPHFFIFYFFTTHKLQWLEHSNDRAQYVISGLKHSTYWVSSGSGTGSHHRHKTIMHTRRNTPKDLLKDR